MAAVHVCSTRGRSRNVTTTMRHRATRLGTIISRQGKIDFRRRCRLPSPARNGRGKIRAVIARLTTYLSSGLSKSGRAATVHFRRSSVFGQTGHISVQLRATNPLSLFRAWQLFRFFFFSFASFDPPSFSCHDAWDRP